MKKYVIIGIMLLAVSGCASIGTVTKTFKVIADPPDSVIKVISGPEQKEQKYSSPAEIEVDVPKNTALATRSVLEVSKDKYKPTIIPLRHISDGDTIKVKLQKIVTYQLKYRLIAPMPSDEMKFQDKSIAISFSVGEESFQMSLTNLGMEPLRIRWQSAEYTDVHGQPRRLMHSGISYQNRGNPIPDQLVPSHGSIKEAVTPIENVYVSPQTRGYEVKPLFTRDGDGASALKGRVLNLFIPIEIDRQIIPYNFKIEISDAVQEK